jgi:LEA14-like dessication related protein
MCFNASRSGSIVRSRRSFVILFALALASCVKPTPPTVTPKALRVVTIRPTGLELQVELDVYNPNSFPLVVSSVEGVVELGGGVELGRARSSLDGRIPAKTTTPVSSRISVSWTNLPALSPFLLTDQPVEYRFRGTAAVGGERLNVNLPFELQGKLTRAELLQAGIAALPR